jgi:outer membrane protein insertion porin family/translocation and assembly module TamA
MRDPPRRRASILAGRARLLVAVLARTGAAVAAIVVGVGLLTGCTSVPRGRMAIDVVKVHGAHALDPDEVTDRLATTESPKFLGLVRGIVYDYSIYDESVLQRDLARVERYYRGHGFFEAHARAGRVSHVSASHVRVDIVVDEGPPMLDRQVTLVGIDALPAADVTTIRAAARKALPTGTRFDEDSYKKAQDTVTRALMDQGYAYASLKADAQADLGAHAIDYVLTVTPGIRAVFGSITFLGLDPDGSGPAPAVFDEKPFRRAIDIHPGDKYSSSALDAATEALLDLEVLSAVQIQPTLSDPPSPVVPLVVQVQPAKVRLLRLGGGFELDTFKTDVHALVGWEDHNFLGGLRDFSAEVKPGLVFYPLRIGNCCTIQEYLPEERLRLQLRQPGFIEARTVGFIQPELNVYPLLVESNPQPGQPVVGYLEPKVSVGLNRRFGKYVNATLAYNVQSEIPFAYTGSLDPTIKGTDISLLFPQLIVALDLRDNSVHPHAGIYLSTDFQVAGIPGSCQQATGPPASSSAKTCSLPSDFRLQPEARGYIPLARGITFALKANLGFLFGANYGTQFRQDLTDVQNGTIVPGSASKNVDLEKVYFRGFFSGGPSSNRGYPLRGVSPFGVVPFLNPASVGSQIGQCTSTTGATKGRILTSDCLIPIGGFTLWEASAEVRFDISGPFGAALFCDMGDVSPSEFDVRLSHLHMSCGGGLRYQTPVGPVRLDVGYRIQPLQVVGFKNETAVTQSDPTEVFPDRLLGLPIAIAFGIGEAF